MHALSQMKILQEHMMQEVAQLPQYRALKAIEQVVAELTAIYELQSVERDEAEQRKRIATAVETRLATASNGAPKITPYVPSQRVA